MEYVRFSIKYIMSQIATRKTDVAIDDSHRLCIAIKSHRTMGTRVSQQQET